MSSFPPPPPRLDEPPPSVPRSPSPGDSANGEELPPWFAWSAPVALLTGLGVAIVAGAVVGGVAVATGGAAKHLPGWVNLVATFIQDIALVGSAVLFASMRLRPRPGQFGLRRPFSAWEAVGMVVLGAVAFYMFTLAWTQALGLHQRDQVLNNLGGTGVASTIAKGVLVAIVAPIAEELFFRGFFFTALRTWCGPWVAAVLTGLVFGGIHAAGSPVGFLVPLAFFGFVLCLVRWRTGSLYPCMALHALNNSIAFGLLEGWSWQIPLVLLGAYAAIAALTGPLGIGTPAAPEPAL